MTSGEAVRQHLIDRLQNYDQEGAERLDGGLDKAFLERRLGELNSWKDRWKKWIWIVAFTLGLAMLYAPVASEVGVGVVLGGAGYFFGLIAIINQWRRKKTIYEILAVMADPEREASKTVA